MIIKALFVINLFSEKQYSRKESDFWGNKREVHYEDGEKVGVTKFKKTFWGKTVQEHYDASGQKVGETKKEEGFFSDKAVHYNSKGEKEGYSQDGATIIGEKIQRHYDKSGKKVGKSHHEEELLGGSRKVHEGTYFKDGKSERDRANNPKKII